MRATAPGGMSLAPLHSDHGGTPAVVFLHGIGGAARGWAPQLAAFKAAGLHGELYPHDTLLGDIDPDRYGVNGKEPFFLFAKGTAPLTPA